MARTEMIKIRVTPAELAACKRVAAAHNLSLSGYLRRAALSPDIPKDRKALASKLVALRRALIKVGPSLLRVAADRKEMEAARENCDAAIQGIGDLLRRLR